MRPAIVRVTKKTLTQPTIAHVTKATPLATGSLSCLPQQHQQQVVAMSTGQRYTNEPKKRYQIVIVGGGTGGCSIASKYCRKLGSGNVAVIEPSDKHYYQPMWTLVGAGVKNVSSTVRTMESALPKHCDWIKDKAMEFNPRSNSITTEKGHEIKYDFLVVGTGMQLNYHLIKGAPEALKNDKRVVSNYNIHDVIKTFPALQTFEGGNAIFTSPNTPIKCAGATQKIMYLAEHYFRKNGKRDKARVIFNTSLGALFGVEKYADALQKIVKDRNIEVNYKRNLIEVIPSKSEAVFAKLDGEPGETESYKYEFLHVVPPMTAPDILKSSEFIDAAGTYMDVDKGTLQNVTYPNVYGIGDCMNAPTSKTGAAIASQAGIIKRNIDAAIAGKKPAHQYNGYTSCPLITAYGKCMLTEFDYTGLPTETFPFDQSKERRTMYYAKKDLMPQLYWRLLIKGMWDGPEKFRKLFHLGMV